LIFRQDPLNETPSILIAEHQELMLGAINECLGNRYRIAGVVKDGVSLVSEALRLKPDIVLVNTYLPKLNGLEATAELAKNGCPSKCLVLTSVCEPIILRTAFDSGAVGCLLHQRLAVDLPPAIEAVRNGESFISPPLIDRRTSLLL
jgi:DNA-binding NarL/FixJ family response regulator